MGRHALVTTPADCVGTVGSQNCLVLTEFTHFLPMCPKRGQSKWAPKTEKLLQKGRYILGECYISNSSNFFNIFHRLGTKAICTLIPFLYWYTLGWTSNFLWSLDLQNLPRAAGLCHSYKAVSFSWEVCGLLGRLSDLVGCENTLLKTWCYRVHHNLSNQKCLRRTDIDCVLSAPSQWHSSNPNWSTQALGKVHT